MTNGRTEEPLPAAAGRTTDGTRIKLGSLCSFFLYQTGIITCDPSGDQALSPPSRFGSPGFSSTVMGLGGGSSLNKRRRRVIAQRRLLAVIPLQMPPKRRARCAFLLTMVEMGASRDIAFLCLPHPRPPAAPPPRARAPLVKTTHPSKRK